MAFSATEVTVLTATHLETRIARRTLPRGMRVVEVGAGFVRAPAARFSAPVVSCGLAGGIRRDVPSGTVLVPQQLVREDGERRACDPELFGALVRAARRCGVEPLTLPLASSASLVRGASRERYARLGCAGVDMESAFIVAPRVAAVRVVLDTPDRELSEAWIHPLRALLCPRAWGELPWLAREAPRYAALAARVVRAACTNPRGEG